MVENETLVDEVDFSADPERSQTSSLIVLLVDMITAATSIAAAVLISQEILSHFK